MIKSLYAWAMSRTLPVNDFKEVGNTSHMSKVFMEN